jgi:hypothetical protein
MDRVACGPGANSATLYFLAVIDHSKRCDFMIVQEVSQPSLDANDIRDR